MSTFPYANTQRILVGSMTAKIRVTLLDQDGTPADASGTLTVDLTRLSDGTVLGTGRATANPSGNGTYTADLTAAECASLDVLEATWKDGTTVRAVTRHRVVGGFMFSRPELRAMAGLTNVGQFSDAMLDSAREWVTDLIEDNTGVSWSPTFDIERHWLVGSDVVVLRHLPVHSLRSVSIDGVAQVVSTVDLDRESGVLRGGWFAGEVLVGYEHGFSQPTSTLRDAALEAARDHLLRKTSGLSDRTRSVTNDLGVTQQFSYPGPGHPTGIDSVDAVILAHDHRLPSVG